ncbi:Necrosis inducing-like protein NPP1 type [Phytophthora palmivora]|uniref:Necrosis inducing-like protein NPP1 type n=1 Tax=Phytophthora palmivora TaxID=4796 RepID=A0A2P4XGG8_9STRA|nr:Necrosis inducing-like protein NPP1 type [Phytophthora palmivora]
MNICGLFFILVVLIETAQADANSINHDLVQPFDQPEPVTDEERAAVRFKPQLHISYGCHPYPAVQANGSISGGLQWSGPPDGECQGSELGSQVYARTAWYKDKFAIMYAWYFPKGYQLLSKYHTGYRHFWRSAVVWIDDPADNSSTIQGVSVHSGTGYKKRAPPKSIYVDGSSVKLDSYKSFWGLNAALRLTEKGGDNQDLIMWDQLTDEAREALNGEAFDIKILFSTIQMPLKDEIFMKTLEKVWPF